MKKNPIPFLLAAVLLLTAVLAGVHLTTREQVSKGHLVITYQDKRQEIVFSQLPLQQVQGIIVNGKGEAFPIDANGLSAEAFLQELGISNFSKITVVADDEYRVEVSADEIAADGVVNFIAQADGGVQLLVFTDTDSKRNVTNVVRLEVL